jgi:hypothetical protein
VGTGEELAKEAGGGGKAKEQESRRKTVQIPQRQRQSLQKDQVVESPDVPCI